MVTTWLPVEAGSDLWDLIPGASSHLRALYAGLWEADVDAATLELCRLRVAMLVGSPEDVAARDPRAPLDQAMVDELPRWPTSAAFTDAQRAAVGFAEQYTLDAHGVTDDQAAGMHSFFSPPQLATLTTAIAVFDALARLRAVVTAPTGTDAAISVDLM